MSRVSIISISNMLLLTIIMMLAWFEILSFDLLFTYRWHKFLHLAGVVVFLGNVVLGPLWVALALKSKNIDTVRFCFKTLQEFDIYITAPSVFLLIINGLYMANVFGGVGESDWLRHTVYSLIVLWGLIIPILVIQEKMDKKIGDGDITSDSFLRLKNTWVLIGVVSFFPIIYICFMMIFKTIC